MPINTYSDLKYGAKYNNVRIDDVDEIVLEITGRNEGPDWHWIVRRCDGGYAYIVGGCDYTGWDCQSSMDRHDADTLEAAILLAPQDERRIFEDMKFAGETVRAAA